MTLRQYLALTGMTQQQFAEAINVSQGAVSRYVSGLSTPRKACLRRILDFTEGAVTPTDFVFEKVNGHSTFVNGKFDDAA